MRRTWAVATTTGVVAALAMAGPATSHGVAGLWRGEERHPATQQQREPERGRGEGRPATEPPQRFEPRDAPGRPHPPRERQVDPEAAPTGTALLAPGDRGPAVRELQARLRQIAWFSGDVTDFYGDLTRAAVTGFQAKRGLPPTGVADEHTLARLEGMTVEPTADELANVTPDPADGAPLDPRCTTGHVLCIDKTSSSLRWVVDGDVRLTLDARFGGNGYFTREGAFSVYRKSRDHVSSLYDTSMPFALFFSGGEAVHYSPDFAATGYAGTSHGCVNIRDYEAMAGLFDEVQLGDAVVVYWS